MRLLYKCRKYRWRMFFEDNRDEMEAYYLELKIDELSEELMGLLKNQEKQKKNQFKEFNKLYIIIDRDKEFAFYVPGAYGPHWPASGHWDMSDNFKSMYGIELKNIDDIKNIKMLMLENAIKYIDNSNDIFGNINDFRFGFNGPECFSSAIAESYIYHFFKKRGQNPSFTEEETKYNFTVNGKRILVKTNAYKMKNGGYDWSNNSCWKKMDEIETDNWDFLYYVPITWVVSKYQLYGIYKISYKELHENKILISKIRKNIAWFIPVDFDNHSEWIEKFRID